MNTTKYPFWKVLGLHFTDARLARAFAQKAANETGRGVVIMQKDDPMFPAFMLQKSEPKRRA